ncbi:glutaredoxin family protein [Bacillus mycoides]|uniref:glutaredoxin family protein n=1 Tax=Bacillus mycoides TaxID=1405 RepID=UPI00273CB3A0|nr:glutaredoxin domain-containing protein [Bacillus mycoides]
MATKIVMYTGLNCSKCKRAKEMLKNCPVEVELIERNVDEDEKYKIHLISALESNTLPTFVIPTKEGEEEKIFRGFDENIGKIMEVLGL